MADEYGRYSRVYRRIWRDEKFRSLSDKAKLLFLRLVTGPELGSIPGLLACTDAGMASSMGWSLEAFREAFGEAFSKAMAKGDWRAGLVWLPNAPKYNKPESPNVIRGWRREWPEVPECALKRQAFRDLKAFAEGLGEAFAKAFGEAFGDPSPNQEQEQEQEQEQDPKGVLSPSGDTHKDPDPEPDAFKLHPPTDHSVGERPDRNTRLKHIGPDTPIDGLDPVDRARKMWARKWGEVYGGNGAVFPDSPGPDRKVVGGMFSHHRTNKIQRPLNGWCSDIFDAFLNTKNDRLLVENYHALRFLPGVMPRLVAKVAAEWASQGEEAKAE